MNFYNPVLITLFTGTWTAGMAAMMFPPIIPMVLLYKNSLTNNQSDLSQELVELKILYTFKIMLFISMYVVICMLMMANLKWVKTHMTGI